MTVVHDFALALCDADPARAVFMPHHSVSHGHSATGEVTKSAAAHLDLAMWLVKFERDAPEGPLAASVAAGRVSDKLSVRVAQLITPVGAEALLRRAVHVTRAEFAFLGQVQSEPGAHGLIDELQDAAATVEPSLGQAGLETVLATMIALLQSFIGQELTIRLLRDVWPALPAVTPSSASEAHPNATMEKNP